MRLFTKLLVVLAALTVLVPLAAVADVTYVETAERLFLRGEGCGADTNLYLSVRSADDDYDGCGTIGGLPVNEAIGSENTLATVDMGNIIVDASRDLEVEIRTESWFGDGIPGAGESVVEVSISGTPVGGGFIPVELGSASSSILVTGADNATHKMTIDIPDNANLKELTNVSLTISWRGANVNVNNLGMSGDSFFIIPTLTPVAS